MSPLLGCNKWGKYYSLPIIINTRSVCYQIDRINQIQHERLTKPEKEQALALIVNPAIKYDELSSEEQDLVNRFQKFVLRNSCLTLPNTKEAQEEDDAQEVFEEYYKMNSSLQTT